MIAVLTALAALLFISQTLAQDDCHPVLDKGVPQYIIGYGSLMETASKQRTAPNTGANLPVQVSDYQRAWNTKGSDTGFSMTYLGVSPATDADMVAALYRVFDGEDIEATDQRESFYCRVLVKPEQLRMLEGTVTPTLGQIWIYVNKPENVDPPTANFPIVQSYVDIFINGCLELEQTVDSKRVNFKFSEACITTTAEWSEHWVNDRIYPRRPFIYQPNAYRIDVLLKRMMPDLFDKIRIE